MIALPESRRKMFDAVEAGGERNVRHREICILKVHGCILQPHMQQELMRGVAGEGAEDAAEMEGAYMAMLRQVLERYIVVEMLHQIGFCALYRAQVVLFEPRADLFVRVVIGDAA